MMGDTLAALRHVQNAGVDATVDLEFFARSTAVISFLTGARIRVGYHSWSGEGPFRGDLMTHRLFFNHHLHTSDAFQMHVEALEQPAKNLPFFESDIRLSFGCMDRGGPVKTLFELESRDDDYPAIAVSDAEMEGVRSKLEAAGAESVKGRRLVLLNPNCGDMLPLRRWPEENYIALAQGLLDAHGDIVIALTGGPAEAEVVDALSGKISRDRCFSMAGRTTMKELMVLYHLATVLVTNDSGPAHFTSLTPMHSVVLFGPESPALFGSRSSRSHLLWAGTAFTPCVHALNNRETPSEDNSCMSLIPVEDVLATVEGILQRG
jgi:ADP-heptose:LPS heptosyltransferase